MIDTPQTAIVTDRPDFTEASLSVGRGVLQLENGVTFLRQGGLRQTYLPETLVRYGISERWEARVGVPNYFTVTGDTRASGMGDTYVGAKYQVFPADRDFTLSFIPALLVPTGDRRLRSEAVSPEVKICLSKPLSERYTLSGMVYLSNPKEEGRRNATVQNTLSLGQSLTEKVGAFYEVVFTNARRGAPENLLHAGFTYQPTPDRQWDIHVATGISAAAPDTQIAFGYSIRFR